MVDVPLIDIGEDKPSITAKPVLVKFSRLAKDIKKKDGTIVGDKVIFMCQHPDKVQLIELGKIKYEKNGKLDVSALWFRQDADGKIPYKSALANLMRFYNIKNIQEFDLKKLETVMDDEGYLCIKAY